MTLFFFVCENDEILPGRSLFLHKNDTLLIPVLYRKKYIEKHPFMVKNKRTEHSFIQKTNKKRFYYVIFTILLLRESKGLLTRKLPVDAAKNLTVGIERRHLQVFLDVLFYIFIRLVFQILLCFLFWAIPLI